MIISIIRNGTLLEKFQCSSSVSFNDGQGIVKTNPEGRKFKIKNTNITWIEDPENPDEKIINVVFNVDKEIK